MADVTARRRFAPLVVLAAIVVMLLVAAAPAWAHDATDGSTGIDVDDTRVLVTGSVAFADLGFVDTTGDGLLDRDELTAQEETIAATLVATVRDHVSLEVDGAAIDVVGAGVPSVSEFDADDTGASPYVLLVVASEPHDGDVSDVGLDWTFESPSSTVVLSHPDAAMTGQFGQDDTFSGSLGTWSTAGSFFALGIDHIRFGPDHLLFLLVLTIAVAGTSVTAATTRQTVKLVTAFTIGHAISLGLAYFELVEVPAWIVEPAISLSIVAAAVLAIRGRNNDARPWIAAAVGVVHGLGFASSLASLGVATSQQAVALAAFNIGIDIAQTMVVLLVLGALWLITQVLANRMVWVRIAVASGAAVMGVAWTVSRLAQLPV